MRDILVFLCQITQMGHPDAISIVRPARLIIESVLVAFNHAPLPLSGFVLSVPSPSA
jgi:hypothetical protein